MRPFPKLRRNPKFERFLIFFAYGVPAVGGCQECLKGRHDTAPSAACHTERKSGESRQQVLRFLRGKRFARTVSLLKCVETGIQSQCVYVSNLGQSQSWYSQGFYNATNEIEKRTPINLFRYNYNFSKVCF